MESVKVTIDLPKEAHEFANGLANVVAASIQACADGFQPGQDLPAILVSAVAEMPAAVGGLSGIGEEFKADKGKILLALSVALDKVL